ncbi:MAG TPA: hypothetical protein VGX28_06555 [Frankiaceae bacterium]|jgi:hypothetical protein|nr:hypothetical protein [Frankiaceae bacterium]
MKRTLRLNRESLTEISPQDLTGIVGGDEVTTGCPHTFYVLACITPLVGSR